MAYYKKERYGEAIDNFSEAIKLDGNAAEPWKQRGLAYFMKGEFKKAIEDFKRYLELNPEDADVRMVVELARKNKL